MSMLSWQVRCPSVGPQVKQEAFKIFKTYQQLYIIIIKRNKGIPAYHKTRETSKNIKKTVILTWLCRHLHTYGFIHVHTLKFIVPSDLSKINIKKKNTILHHHPPSKKSSSIINFLHFPFLNDKLTVQTHRKQKTSDVFAPFSHRAFGPKTETAKTSALDNASWRAKWITVELSRGKGLEMEAQKTHGNAGRKDAVKKETHGLRLIDLRGWMVW